jgi:hypothetical protein
MARGTHNKVQPGVLSSVELMQLYRWNRWLAIVHVVEGIAIFLFGTAYSVPIIANYLAVNPINSAVDNHTVLSAATRPLFNVSIPGLIAIYFLITALGHSLLTTVYRKRYEVALNRGVNLIRWIEYGVTAGLMLVLVGLMSGVYDLGSLVAIFGFMVIMNLFGLIVELTSKGSRPNWLAYWSGGAAGFVPWLIIALYAFNSSYYGEAHLPIFVYWVYGTMLICMIGFALNMYMHYKKQGKWASYAYTERSFMLLSLVTKSVLAWQIFAGVLRP